MVTVGKSSSTPDYDRKAELMAFDQTKTGVKGLVDAGITEVPRIFLQPSTENRNSDQPSPLELSLPTIDLEGINQDPIRRKHVLEQVKDAMGTCGFFQMVNHEIPINMLEEMKIGVLGFFEQDDEMKKQWYTRDDSGKRKVVYNSNFDLYAAPVTNWRDTFSVTMAPNPPQPDELPLPCSLLGLVAPRYLFHMEELGSSHAQLVQIKNQWNHVLPVPGALVVNGGDLLQLVTNDKFVSSRHKVVANKVGPRVSVASFFMSDLTKTSKVLEPIKELVLDDIPANYRGTTGKEFIDYFMRKGLDGTPALLHFKI